jgi:hypothetical protein
MVTVAYAVVLVWAGGLTADPAAAQVTTGEVAGVLPAAPAGVDATLAVANAPATAAEEPLVTLALAGGMVVFAALAYLAHVVRARRTRRGPVATVRLVARHITTLL